MCEHPQLFTNPTAYRLIEYATELHCCGVCYFHKDICTLSVGLRRQIFYSCKQFQSLVRDKNGCLADSPVAILSVADSCYIVVGGNRINYFSVIPCNHCSLCADEKRQQLEKRAMFEASDNPYMYFFTLTYDNEHLPSIGLNQEHMQLFMKRFRRNIERASSTGIEIEYYSHESSNVHGKRHLYKNKRKEKKLIKLKHNYYFRSFYVGEYGTDPNFTLRAHYHGVFFFKEEIEFTDLISLRDIFVFSWSYGRLFDFQKVDKPFAAAKYITKYLTKLDKNIVPSGHNPTFYQGPTKDGGLGAYKFFENTERIESILNSTNGSVYLRIGDQVSRVGIPKFLIDKLFPSVSRVCPNATKYYLIHCICLRLLQELNQTTEYCPFDRFLPFDDDVTLTYRYLSDVPFKRKSLMEKIALFEEYARTRNADWLLMILEDTENKLRKCPDFNGYLSLVNSKSSFMNALALPDLTPEERYRSKFNKMLNNVIYVEKKLFCEKNNLLLHSEVV